ncbi:MAG: prolipoprotein diacylglyceryl transferase family protein [Patescibacteria group bacterium]
MYPLLFKIGNFGLSTFGLFLGLAVVFGIYFFVRSARRAGFSEEKALDYILICLAAGLVLSRLISYFEYPAAGFWHSGYSFTAGIIGFGLLSYLYVRRLRWSVLKIGDCVIPAALAGFSFAQLGFYLGVSGKTGDLFVALIYFALALSSFVTLKKEPRTGTVFYWYGSVLFSFYYLYKLSQGQLFKLGSLLVLALAVYFVVGLKRRGYFMEANLSKDFLQKIKDRLMRYLHRINEQEAQVKSEDNESRNEDASRNSEFEDEAENENQHTLAQTIGASLSQMKNQIKKAMLRMNSGKYGICERCGGPIDKARLEAFPEATLCLRCEQLRENKTPEGN